MSTPTEINQAIARACGWKYCPPPIGGAATANWRRPDASWSTHCPDYCGSLDAMATAEATLTDVQYKAYGKEIVMEATRLHGNGPEMTYHRFILSCPALHRATAFCRVLNLETK